MRALKFAFYFMILSAYSATAVYAQDPPKIEGLTEIFQKVIFDIAPKFAGLVALIMIIVGGYMWMTSEGDPQKIQQAQGTLTWAILGLVFFATFSYAIYLLMDFLGVPY